MRRFEARSNQLAHFLRSQDLQFQDHYSIFMENNERYMESCAAGERAGLYYTCINSYLTGDELAYIVNNSESKVLITSKSKIDVVVDALASCPNIQMVLVTDGGDVDLPKGMMDFRRSGRGLLNCALGRGILGYLNALFIWHDGAA